MKPELSSSLILLKEACDTYSYSWRIVDNYSNNLIEVSYKNKSFFSSYSKLGIYPLNSRFSAELVSDKAWAYQVLKSKNYKTINGEYFFINKKHRQFRGEKREIEDAFLFSKNKYPVFVKPNQGSQGHSAEIIYNKKELLNYFVRAKNKTAIILIQEVIDFQEYRIFAIDGKVKFVYRRVKPAIIGDGEKSVEKLIKEFNRNIKNNKNKIFKESLFIKKQLKDRGIGLKTILNKNQSLIISEKANLSAGGTINDYTEMVSKKTAQWVKKIMSDFNLRICGIDIFVKKTINNPNSFIVIEINSSPSLLGIYRDNREDKALEIWREILEKYFQK